MAVAATTIWSDTVIKAFLDIDDSSEDALVDRLGDGITAYIERKTGRLFVGRTHTEIRSGHGHRDLVLNHRPVTTFTSLTILRAPNDATPETISSDDWRADLQSGILHLNQTVFTRGVANVTATYNAGYGDQDVLANAFDIFEVGLEMVKIVYDLIRSGGLASTTVVAGGASFTANVQWPHHIKDTLAHWKRSDLGSQ